LNAAYERQSREKEATPKQMFQLVVLGFMEGITSTRKLECACKQDIRKQVPHVFRYKGQLCFLRIIRGHFPKDADGYDFAIAEFGFFLV